MLPHSQELFSFKIGEVRFELTKPEAPVLQTGVANHELIPQTCVIFAK